MKNQKELAMNKISQCYALALKDLKIKITESLSKNFISIFENVISRYSEPHRYFHTVDHIAHVLNCLTVTNPEVILAAIYHDIIYVPGSDQNEYCSAQLAANHLSMLGAKNHVIFTVSKHILSTEQHVPIDLPGNKELLDADMSILASCPKVFKEYCTNIKFEFPHLSSPGFESQRSRWALEQLGRKQIFYCNSNKRLERQARVNLRLLTNI